MQHELDEEGQQLWGSWISVINDRVLGEANHKFQLLLFETIERAARIALVLHRLDAACSGVIPSVIVPTGTLDRSMEFAMWLQWQAEASLQTTGDYGER
jgi:hypothetical protein